MYISVILFQEYLEELAYIRICCGRDGKLLVSLSSSPCCPMKPISKAISWTLHQRLATEEQHGPAG